MNIHEYQAKEVLAAFNVPVPKGFPAFSAEEAVEAAKKLGGNFWVVKAQIHAGGRGKGKFKELPADAKGGVRLCTSLEAVEANAKEMIGNTLVTIQTGEIGKEVKRLYVSEGANITKEFYLSLLVDRESGRVAFVVSQAGGMDIEGVAHDTPEAITTVIIEPATGVSDADIAAVVKCLDLSGDLAAKAAPLCRDLYTCFTKSDMSMLEVNPLIIDGDSNNLVCLDAKVSFDSNAEYRHPEWAAMRDLTEEDEKEIEASKFDLTYITLDGTIGCMVNGAGLAMATMDIIKLYGEEPANFLDVGGGASREKVTEAFKIITSDPKVKGILVNIFGGIMRCDVIAEGVVSAVKDVGLKVPLVVRLEGTNVEMGKEILRSSGLAVIPADDLADAAQKIVEAVRAA